MFYTLVGSIIRVWWDWAAWMEYTDHIYEYNVPGSSGALPLCHDSEDY